MVLGVCNLRALDVHFREEVVNIYNKIMVGGVDFDRISPVSFGGGRSGG